MRVLNCIVFANELKQKFPKAYSGYERCLMLFCRPTCYNAISGEPANVAYELYGQIFRLDILKHFFEQNGIETDLEYVYSDDVLKERIEGYFWRLENEN